MKKELLNFNSNTPANGEDSPESNKIRRVLMQGAPVDFSALYYRLQPDAPIYLFPQSKLEALDARLNFDALIAIRPLEEFHLHQMILAKCPYENRFCFGQISFERELHLYLLCEYGNPMPHLLRDLLIVGDPAGIHSLTNEETAIYEFSPFGAKSSI